MSAGTLILFNRDLTIMSVRNNPFLILPNDNLTMKIKLLSAIVSMMDQSALFRRSVFLFHFSLCRGIKVDSRKGSICWDSRNTCKAYKGELGTLFISRILFSPVVSLMIILGYQMIPGSQIRIFFSHFQINLKIIIYEFRYKDMEPYLLILRPMGTLVLTCMIWPWEILNKLDREITI